MQLEVKIDQEAVQQQLVQAIFDSAIGTEIQKAIDKSLKAQSSHWNAATIVEDAVRTALGDEIRRQVIAMVETKRETIRVQLEEKLTDELISKMTNAAWDVMDGRLGRT